VYAHCAIFLEACFHFNAYLHVVDSAQIDLEVDFLGVLRFLVVCLDCRGQPSKGKQKEEEAGQLGIRRRRISVESMHMYL
jgi:hypothetical protein